VLVHHSRRLDAARTRKAGAATCGRVFRDTTMPATIPNPTCDSTNQSQLIRLIEHRMMMPERAVEGPDHISGAMKREQNRPPRQHRQRPPVEHPDQQRRQEVERDGHEERPEMDAASCSVLAVTAAGRSRPRAG